MSWPTPADYQDAIQSPSTCFKDADLKGGTAKMNTLGLPQVASGNFASVYRITNVKSWAVRCFLRDTPDAKDRYREICNTLSGIQTYSLLTVEFLADGILVLGSWYPVVKMQWTDSQPISSWVANNLHTPPSLIALSDSLRYEVNLLQTHGVAHGDLQHGNVFVRTNGHIEFVDYDGMFVPAFVGQPSPELGHVNFQHPKRQPADYHPYLDNFSALVIITSLTALAHQPGLWNKYNTGENLIFTQADFLDPKHSSVFCDLIANGTPEVRDLAAGLAGCCAKWPLAPEPLDAFLGRLPSLALPANQFNPPTVRKPFIPQPPRVPSVSQINPPVILPRFRRGFLASVAALLLIALIVFGVSRLFQPNKKRPIEIVDGRHNNPASDKKDHVSVIPHKSVRKKVAVPKPPTPPSIASFEVVPNSVTPCAMVVLRWTVKSADTVHVEPDIGKLPASGYRLVFPRQTTEYKISASGVGGSVTKTVLLSVSHPATGPCLR